jgi:hypothetical protein
MLKIKPKIKNSKGIAFVVAGLTLAMISTCATPAFGIVQERLIEKNSKERKVVPFTIEYIENLEEQERLEYQKAIDLEIRKEEYRISSPFSDQSRFVNEALKYENTGIWVFGGSSPGAWDCSGFIKYIARESLGFDLYHSATAQMNSGVFVNVPITGDLVGLYYQDSSEMSSHVGIYIGDGKFIHVSEKRGTIISEVSKYEKNYDVRYSRIIEKDRNWDPVKELEKNKKFNFFNN